VAVCGTVTLAGVLGVGWGGVGVGVGGGGARGGEAGGTKVGWRYQPAATCGLALHTSLPELSHTCSQRAVASRSRCWVAASSCRMLSSCWACEESTANKSSTRGWGWGWVLAEGTPDPRATSGGACSTDGGCEGPELARAVTPCGLMSSVPTPTLVRMGRVGGTGAAAGPRWGRGGTPTLHARGVVMVNRGGRGGG
jgi:hypothetical protein